MAQAAVRYGAFICHRALRDERRCSAQYGPPWEEYCARARFRMFPLID